MEACRRVGVCACMPTRGVKANMRACSCVGMETRRYGGVSGYPSCLLFLPLIAVPGLLLLFPHDCVCGGGARGGGRLVRGSGEVGLSEKVSLSEKIVLVLLTVEAGAVKASSRFLLPRGFLDRAIKACAIKVSIVEADSGSYRSKRVRFLEAGLLNAC
jgi:hypothetical protein